ncbi:hypothetical protein HOP50_01g09150 [Chloropicon primus]|uniref:Uncharacterized protein n=1 Tax=Chloropicon primus TaxID=1764295 RepID=A0A5B8MDC2_9CHLO|nr:hypothetical protein A3770_01p09270 [Chloropicon primus]UPQ97620.1 hypothetical protein HOP50_01g09150 [Chloropicon primus]|eukprot:QDZ18409.1 hypothetical protein A3770_01p09270 [Chloropicon primus]
MEVMGRGQSIRGRLLRRGSVQQGSPQQRGRRGHLGGLIRDLTGGRSSRGILRSASEGEETKTTTEVASSSEKFTFPTVEETKRAAAKTAPPKSRNIDRADLYTDNWAGDTYQGSGVNILTVLVGIGLGVPLVGLVFAYLTWGELWGT